MRLGVSAITAHANAWCRMTKTCWLISIFVQMSFTSPPPLHFTQTKLIFTLYLRCLSTRCHVSFSLYTDCIENDRRRNKMVWERQNFLLALLPYCSHGNHVFNERGELIQMKPMFILLFYHPKQPLGNQRGNPTNTTGMKATRTNLGTFSTPPPTRMMKRYAESNRVVLKAMRHR